MLTRAATQKIAIAGIGIVVAVALVLFVYRGYYAYMAGPEIEVTEPQGYTSFSTSTVTIAGRALRVQDISLNGRQILIDDKGDFKETVLLFPGYNIETIAAHDRFGHAATRRLELVYAAPQKVSAATEGATSTLPR